MPQNKNIELHLKFIQWSSYFSLSVITIGVLVLIGWLFDLDFLKRPIPHLVAMNPLTAVLFIMSGFCAYLSYLLNKKQINPLYVNLIALLIFFLASIKSISFFISPDFPIDTFLFSSKIKNEVLGGANRMAPNTAFNFVFIGFSLLILNYEKAKDKIVVQTMALIVLFIGLLSLLGYIYKVSTFYGIPSFIPMAIHTAITFIILSLSIIFLDPDKGLMKTFTSTYAGSTSARILIPVAIFIPVLLGYLRLLGDWSGLYSKEFGVALLILSTIIIFLILIWFNASALNKKDALRKEAEDNLKLLNIHLESEVEAKTMSVINKEKIFQATIESSADIISLTDENNIVFYINPAIENISGYTVQEIKNRPMNDLIFPDDLDQAVANYNVALNNPEKIIPASIRIKNKNGKVIWLEGIIKNMLQDSTIKAIVSNYHDVSERKESEQKIIAIEKKFKATIDNMLEGIQIHDFNWRYTYVNETLVKYSQYSKEELLGYTLMEKYPGIEQSDLFKTFQRCMNERQSAHLETEFTFPNGSKSDFELSIQPIPEGLFILSIDVSDRKKAQKEIEELNQDLEKKVYERTEQLESVNKEMESFSYSVSHDLRAPLRAINGYAKILEEDYGKTLDEEANRLLSTIRYNAQRMGTLIDDLLAFSRLGRKELNKTELDIQELVEGAISELNKTIEHKAEIKIEKLNNSKGDYALINQAFYNLIANAVKYSSKKFNPIVKISSELKDDEVIYCISDNGAGFDMKYVGKLFGVFQRLHSTEEFEGTGVGLAIVQRIINKHGGKVWAEAKINEGASFYFSLPLN